MDFICVLFYVFSLLIGNARAQSDSDFVEFAVVVHHDNSEKKIDIGRRFLFLDKKWKNGNLVLPYDVSSSKYHSIRKYFFTKLLKEKFRSGFMEWKKKISKGNLYPTRMMKSFEDIARLTLRDKGAIAYLPLKLVTMQRVVARFRLPREVQLGERYAVVVHRENPEMRVSIKDRFLFLEGDKWKNGEKLFVYDTLKKSEQLARKIFLKKYLKMSEVDYQRFLTDQKSSGDFERPIILNDFDQIDTQLNRKLGGISFMPLAQAVKSRHRILDTFTVPPKRKSLFRKYSLKRGKRIVSTSYSAR